MPATSRFTIRGGRAQTLLVDLEIHQRVIMRIPRHADVSMTLEIYANACVPMATREEQRGLRGAPSVRRSNLVVVAVLAVFCCCTGSKRGPRHFWCGSLTCGNTGRGDRI